MKALWSNICEWLSEGESVVLLCVIDSQGSSPGRQGFKMAINGKHEMRGSIGGGMMEYKLIEWCKEKLLEENFNPFIKRQIHQTNIPDNKSGMICSGEQTIAFYNLNKSDLKLINQIDDSKKGTIRFDSAGISLKPQMNGNERFKLNMSEEDWSLEEDIASYPVLHIFGGGHVSLALSKLAFELGFQVQVYDERKNLNTMEQNEWADVKTIPDYQSITDHISIDAADYIVLMSFGYRTDKLLLQQLLPIQSKYLGMLGSVEKTKQLFEELSAEGVSEKQLSCVHAPIGLSISSKTPEEIAVSIMAEIIQVKNN